MGTRLPLVVLLAAVFPGGSTAHEVISTNLTWTREVSRIIFHHCGTCHRPGGSAMSLLTYEDARPWAKAIRDEVLARRMPPWDAVKGVGDFRDDPSLSQPEMDILVGWVEGGAPEGNPSYLPGTPHFETPHAARPAARTLELRRSTTLDAPVTLAGIRPEGPLEVAALLPGGAVRRLLWVRDFRPRWNRSYYFRTPVSLPRGTQVLLYSDRQAGARLLLASAGPAPAK